MGYLKYQLHSMQRRLLFLKSLLDFNKHTHERYVVKFGISTKGVQNLLVQSLHYVEEELTWLWLVESTNDVKFIAFWKNVEV
mgnify:CR=1 FL=1